MHLSLLLGPLLAWSFHVEAHPSEARHLPPKS
jgi:hypothetical protein